MCKRGQGGQSGSVGLLVPGQLLVLVAAVIFSSSSVWWFLFWWCWRALGVLLITGLGALNCDGFRKVLRFGALPPEEIRSCDPDRSDSDWIGSSF